MFVFFNHKYEICVKLAA